jgi:predicted metal-dependent hydrolase
MEIKITRSRRRRKTVSAQQTGDTLHVAAPAHMSDAELAPIIEKLQRRIERATLRRRVDDTDLARIAGELNRAHFGGALKWRSITWTANQERKFGSCTPVLGTIRISHRIATMPRFVLEYLVMHELAHLAEPGHGPAFWALVNRYPRTERARGYLMAVGLEPPDVPEG